MTQREFCTLFDSNYLAKGVALHRSLLRHCRGARLTVFCFDDEAKSILDRLRLPQVSTVSLEQLETFDPALRSTKDDRTRLEYCCTATPVLPLYLFATRPGLTEVTYLDADLMFFQSPEPLFEEMGDASVLITPHRFARAYRQHVINGIYNVQFLTFRRDERGLACLRWWHDRCIEWCFFRLEDGKLADQKYLDDWPERFEGVHVLEHKGGGLAPWNIDNYDIHVDEGVVMVDDVPLIFFHYHQVTALEDGDYDWQARGYPIGTYERRIVYDPYLELLDDAMRLIRRVEPNFSAGLRPAPGLRDRLQTFRANAAARVTRVAPVMARVRHR